MVDKSLPAFPVPHAIDGNWNKDPLPEYSGMSLRDWFAGQALAGILASFPPEGQFSTDKSKQALADDSYALADAMLTAKENSDG